jgi:hypothetical protein
MALYSRKLGSLVPTATSRPSGLKLTALTWLLEPTRRATVWLEVVSQMRAELSCDPDTSSRLSGLNASAVIEPVWPRRVAIFCPTEVLYRRIEPSVEPTAA